VTRKARTIRFGASIAVALVGVACGIILNGTLAGTLATILIGLGMVGVVSLIFYEVGLSEDRERASSERAAAEPHSPHRHADDPSPRPGPRPSGSLSARPRPLERRRGERRRLR
jgi:hypothetical protein